MIVFELVMCMVIGTLLGLSICAGYYAVTNWLSLRRSTLRGEMLTITARHVYGLERAPGESDASLRARVKEALLEMVQ